MVNHVWFKLVEKWQVEWRTKSVARQGILWWQLLLRIWSPCYHNLEFFLGKLWQEGYVFSKETSYCLRFRRVYYCFRPICVAPLFTICRAFMPWFNWYSTLAPTIIIHIYLITLSYEYLNVLAWTVGAQSFQCFFHEKWLHENIVLVTKGTVALVHMVATLQFLGGDQHISYACLSF